MLTEAAEQEFKGNKVFAIYEVDPSGNRIKSTKDGKAYPVVSFGSRKARAILNHLNEIRDYVEKFK